MESFRGETSLLQHLARYGTVVGSRRTIGETPKVVLRAEWVDECVERGRVVGADESWGGWEVR
jgi:hypothetical protein